jgi:hypothetical protein
MACNLFRRQRALRRCRFSLAAVKLRGELPENAEIHLLHNVNYALKRLHVNFVPSQTSCLHFGDFDHVGTLSRAVCGFTV